jgi:hypothetical protein
MARSLNNLFLFASLLISYVCFGQTESDAVFRPKDYKSQDQFKHFYKRREIISKWQINQLKNGALVVRLHSNRNLIEQLKKKGHADLATQKEHETFALNKDITNAFLKHYAFSKVYFIYSHHSDTLLKGARSGIFLDSNLVIDQNITMAEEFYMIAEKDLIYNSSIGFVPQDTAVFVHETGTSSKEMGVILKNKYGHQLKDPFPYYVVAKGSPSSRVLEYFSYNGATIRVEMNKRYSRDKYELYVLELNYNLRKFHEKYKDFQVTDPDIKPFLY